MTSWHATPYLPIDQSLLHEYSDGDRDFELELLHLFIHDTQHHLARLRVAIATRNDGIARQEAHHIKGASAHVGAVTMSAIAAEVETQIKQQNLSASVPFFNQLELAYQDVIVQTERWDQESTVLS